MICKNCGKKFPNRYRFCPYCGANIKDTPKESPEAAAEDNLEEAIYSELVKSEQELELEKGAEDQAVEIEVLPPQQMVPKQRIGSDDMESMRNPAPVSHEKQQEMEELVPYLKKTNEEDSEENEEEEDEEGGRNRRKRKKKSEEPLYPSGNKKEHKALTVLKTILSILLMLGLLVCTAGATGILTVRLSLTQESVQKAVNHADLASAKVGTWMGDEEDETLAAYVYKYLDHDYVSQSDVEDILRSDEFRIFAAQKIYSCISYIYRQRGDASITADELADLFEEPVEEKLAEQGIPATSAVHDSLEASFEAAGISDFNMAAIYGLHQNLMDLMHFMTAWSTLAICLFLGLILILLLALTNQNYFHKLFLYYGIPLAITGAAGCVISLLRGSITGYFSKETLVPRELVRSLVNTVTDQMMNVSLILLAVGVLAFLLFLICRMVIRKKNARRKTEDKNRE